MKWNAQQHLKTASNIIVGAALGGVSAFVSTIYYCSVNKTSGLLCILTVPCGIIAGAQGGYLTSVSTVDDHYDSKRDNIVLDYSKFFDDSASFINGCLTKIDESLDISGTCSSIVNDCSSMVNDLVDPFVSL